jgi:hypothetical protein
MATDPYALPDPSKLLEQPVDPLAPPKLQTTAATQPSQPIQAPQTPAFTPATSTAATRTVGQNETVSGQLQGILSSGSPLLQQAQTRATQAMGKRGLINSSMAVGAGESALYDAALPIAGADANTYRAAADLDYATKADTSKFNASEVNKQQGLNQELTSRTNLANLDSATRLQLTDIEARYKTLMQANDSSSKLYTQAVANMNEIMMNKDLDPPAKQRALNNQASMLQTGMVIFDTMNQLNISSLLDFSDEVGPGTISGPGSMAPPVATTPPTEGAPTSTVNQTLDNPMGYSTETLDKARQMAPKPDPKKMALSFDRLIEMGASPEDAVVATRLSDAIPLGRPSPDWGTTAESLAARMASPDVTALMKQYGVVRPSF